MGRGTTAAYRAGAVAYGVKDAGFGAFLLAFYNQVIGLPYAAVGLVVMAGLLIDAAVDPAVGFLLLSMAAALCFARFPFGRAEHEERLARTNGG